MKSKLLFGALALTAALLAACITSDDDPGEEAVIDEKTEATAAPQPTMTVDGSELGELAMPSGYSRSSISCNPNAGGTAYCRQVLQEQTAWCIRQGGWGYCWTP